MTPRRPDVLALLCAGAVDLLAGADAALVLGDGLRREDSDPAERAAWIAEHTTRWQAGWSFWFVVTLTFAWGFYALARHLGGAPQWRHLAVGVALVAAAVDIVGIVVALAVLPDVTGDPATFRAAEGLAHGLTAVTAYGLYTVAGLLLLPGAFATPSYRRLGVVAAVLWGLSALATALLAFDAPGLAPVFALALLLYAAWAWASAAWVARH